MQSATGPLAVAVDQFGRIAELGRVAPAAGLVGAPLVPFLLPVVAAAVAGYVQQQRLAKSIDQLRISLQRIERRMRHDDWAVIDNGNALVRLVLDERASIRVPDQLRLELAVVRHDVERVFRSRQREVNELITLVAKESRGRDNPWTDDVKRKIDDVNNQWEFALYLEAMVTRTRLAICTASILATDSEAPTAMRLIETTRAELQTQYNLLFKTLMPLAKKRPPRGLGALPLVNDGQNPFYVAEHLVETISEQREQVLGGGDEATQLNLSSVEVQRVAAAERR